MKDLRVAIRRAVEAWNEPESVQAQRMEAVRAEVRRLFATQETDPG